jgi:energy-coupling factor transporter ATP-binding protein EcfA2
VLVTGSSGGGKSTIVTALVEQIRDQSYQFCVVDPEGDYDELAGAIVLGDARQLPRVDDVMELLAKPDVNVVVNLLAIDPLERPRFLVSFITELTKLRAATGRPHWLILDEVHHLLPAKWEPSPVALPRELPATIAVTVHPEAVAADFLALISTVIGVGDAAAPVITQFCELTGKPPPGELTAPERGEVLVYRDRHVERVTARRPREKQKRHVRKYAEGELGEDRSFYFRGPNNALNLRAHNLTVFLQLADGVDVDTWRHHLMRGDYSRWFREAIKDEALADEAAAIEQDTALPVEDSRAQLRAVIERRYTAPSRA